MTQPLQISNIFQAIPKNPFLKLEQIETYDPDETALEVALFDFDRTQHQIGARLVYIPPNRAFARHIHPNAYHFIYVSEGTAILEYDSVVYTLIPGDCCVVCKGVMHKLGAGPDGLRAIVVNSPTYDNGDPEHITYISNEILASKVEARQLEGSS